jgi:DDE superfamily endonuclease
MKEKQPQSSGLIRDYISCIFKTSVGKHSDKLLLYADGLVTMKKKGIKGMIRALNARHHTSNISRTLKRDRIKLDTFKQRHILRDGKIDKRKSYFLIIDDTAVRRYGKDIYGSGYNYSGSDDTTIWSNCLVTFQLREKKGR